MWTPCTPPPPPPSFSHCIMRLLLTASFDIIIASSAWHRHDPNCSFLRASKCKTSRKPLTLTSRFFFFFEEKMRPYTSASTRPCWFMSYHSHRCRSPPSRRVNFTGADRPRISCQESSLYANRHLSIHSPVPIPLPACRPRGNRGGMFDGCTIKCRQVSVAVGLDLDCCSQRSNKA